MIRWLVGAFWLVVLGIGLNMAASELFGYGTRAGLWFVRRWVRLLRADQRDRWQEEWEADVIEKAKGPDPDKTGGNHHLTAMAWGFWTLRAAVERSRLLPRWIHSDKAEHHIAGLAFGWAFGLIPACGLGLVSGLVFGLVFGLVVGLAIGSFTMFSRHPYGRLPVEGLDLASGLVLGLVSGLGCGLTFGPVGGLFYGLAFGLGGGLFYGLLFWRGPELSRRVSRRLMEWARRRV